MNIPNDFNKMGKENKPMAFEIVVKPGILQTGMSYGFIPYWNEGGYCKVDWGDGNKEDAVTSGTPLNHRYAIKGTYTVKIKAYCYELTARSVSDTGYLVYNCSDNWKALGTLTQASQMFRYCTNAILDLHSLPKSLVNRKYDVL